MKKIVLVSENLKMMEKILSNTYKINNIFSLIKKHIVYNDNNLQLKYSNFMGESALEATSSHSADEFLYSIGRFKDGRG